MSKAGATHIKRYQFRPHELDRSITPLPGTDDLDEALALALTMPVDVWDTTYERFIAPVDDAQYRALLYRLNAKRRGRDTLKPRWGNIITLGGFAIIAYVLIKR